MFRCQVSLRLGLGLPSYATLLSLTTEEEHRMDHGKDQLQIYYTRFSSVKLREKSVVESKTALRSWIDWLLLEPEAGLDLTPDS